MTSLWITQNGSHDAFHQERLAGEAPRPSDFDEAVAQLPARRAVRKKK